MAQEPATCIIAENSLQYNKRLMVGSILNPKP